MSLRLSLIHSLVTLQYTYLTDKGGRHISQLYFMSFTADQKSLVNNFPLTVNHSVTINFELRVTRYFSVTLFFGYAIVWLRLFFGYTYCSFWLRYFWLRLIFGYALFCVTLNYGGALNFVLSATF